MTGRSRSPTAAEGVTDARGQPRAWLPAASFVRHLVVGILAINVLVAAGLVYVFDDWRRAEEQKFRVSAATVVRLLGKDLDNQYGRVDRSLRLISDEYVEQLAHGAQAFAQWLERVHQRQPAVSFISISDAAGIITHPPDVDGRGPVDISDRNYFIRLRDTPRPGLQISSAITGRISGKTVLGMARRLNEREQRFSGVVVASVPVEYLKDEIAGLFVDADSDVWLLDRELRWVTAFPALPAGAKAGDELTFESLRAAIARAPQAGALVVSAGDGERLLSYARSATYGFYVVVGQPAAVPRAEWRQKVLVGVVAMLLFALLTTLLARLLSRSWQEQSAITASLLERDEWVRQAQQAGGLALFSYDVDERRFVVSDALYDITGTDEGYPRTWSGWLALVHPDDRAPLDGAFRGVLSGSDDVPPVEYRIVRPLDGGLRWVRSVIHRVAAPEGARPRITGVVVDISVQKRDEDALRSSEQLFRAAFENSMIGMATTSPEKGWLTLNQTLCEILGYDREELRQKTWAELTHPDDLAGDVALFNRVLAGEIDAYELDKRFVRKNGEVVDTFIAARALRRADGSIDFFVALVQDITARKRIEARLRQSEAELRATFEQAAVGIALVAPDGRWLSVNQRLCDMLGYRREELIGRNFQEITHHDDVGGCFSQFGRMLCGEIATSVHEMRYIRSDGGTLWTNVTVSLLCSDDGRPKHFLAIIEDITARRAAERQSRQARQLLTDFLDHFPGMATIKDQSLRFVHCNRGVQEEMGLDLEQILGRSTSELFPGQFGEQVDALERRVLASGQAEVVKLQRGARVHQTTKFVIRQDDGPPLLGGIALDMSRPHRLEQRTRALLEINELAGSLAEKAYLTHSLALAEKLTDSAVGFLHFVNEDQETIELVTWTEGAHKACSAAFDSHYPISRAGIWGDCCRERRAVVVNDYAGHAATRRLPTGHAPLQRLISVPVIDDGAVRMMLAVGNKSIDYDDDDVASVQLIANDVWNIVRRARSEKALATRLAEVTELKDKLEEAHLQLLQSEKMSAIGQLAAGVAHELNNPIGFVYSNLGTLCEYVEDLLAIDAAYRRSEELLPAGAGAGASVFDEVRRLKADRDHAYLVEDLPKLIRESKEGLERVRKIVLDLRDFSRVGESEWQWTDLEKGLESTINIVWNELKYKANVEREYTPLPPVRCLASQLNQVFMNLLVNAAQAIETSGTIVIRTGSEADAAGTVDSVWAEIEDSGRGMSPEVQKRLFEPFFTTKQVGQGTGLGLSISFGIIAKHNGRIDFRSEVGHGTTFRITLPIDGGQATVATL